MDKQSKKYFGIIFLTQALICIVVIVLLFFSFNDISNHNHQLLRMAATKDAEECMRKMVDNTIVIIDMEREKTQAQVLDWAKNAALHITSEEDVIDTLAAVQNNPYGTTLQVAIMVSNNQAAVYENNLKDIDRINLVQLDDLQADSSIWLPITRGAFQFVVFAKEADVREIVKTTIHDQIHAEVYDENEYIWVNEILNMDGGDNYAIRLIHPNLTDSEGDYLSTLTKDVKGNLPYLKELEGIKEKGEIFQTYYFKNKSNDEIAEKLSYAKLYEPYNWVIATGSPMAEIFSYADNLLNYDKYVMHTAILICLLGSCIIFGFGFFIMLRVQKKYRSQIETYIVAETELDPLTGALSRKTSQRIFDQIKAGQASAKDDYFLAMIDIDSFKRVNDSYGHDVGDLVLKKVVEAITSVIRASDFLFRWGGEEFLLLCPEIPKNKQHEFAKKILDQVHNVSFEVASESFHVSISIGGTYWEKGNRIDDTIKRADIALYEAKHNGKNRYCAYSGKE